MCVWYAHGLELYCVQKPNVEPRVSASWAYFDKRYRTPESNDAHVNAAMHAPNQRICQADRKSWTAVALHYMHYNFCRIHQTLRVTPAMEAGIADHVWSIEEIVSLLDRSARIAA